MSKYDILEDERLGDLKAVEDATNGLENTKRMIEAAQDNEFSGAFSSTGSTGATGASSTGLEMSETGTIEDIASSQQGLSRKRLNFPR